MSSNFDAPVERTGTGSIKWDLPGLGHRAAAGDAGLSSVDDARLLPMGVADMDFRTSPAIIDALTARVHHGVFGYTRCTDAYFDAVRSWLGRRHGWGVQRDWIVPTFGTVPAINIAIQMLTEPGDGILIQPPVFHPFADSIENNGRRVVRSPLILEQGRYHMDLVDLAAKAVAGNARMLILCSPHNPVGRVWSASELREVGRICAQHDLIVVCDEVHCDLTYSWSRFVTFAVAAPELTGRLVHCHGPTKTFNLPGLKVSTTIIPDERLRARFLTGLRNLNELFGMSTLGCVALQTAYEAGEPWLSELLGYLEGNVRLVEEFLAQHLPQVRLLRPDATYLAWLDCRALVPPGIGLREWLAEVAQVWVEDGATYGPQGRGFLRMNIACPRRVLQVALRRIAAAVPQGSFQAS